MFLTSVTLMFASQLGQGNILSTAMIFLRGSGESIVFIPISISHFNRVFETEKPQLLSPPAPSRGSASSFYIKTPKNKAIFEFFPILVQCLYRRFAISA